MKKLVLSTFFTLLMVVCWSQPSSRISLNQYQKAISKAKADNDLINLNQYLNAQYQINKDYKSALLLAQSYYDLRDYNHAQIWYEKAINDPLAQLENEHKITYIKVLISLEKHSQALDVFEQLNKLNEDQKKQVELLKEGIRLSKKLVQKNETLNIRPLSKGVNTLLAEHNTFLNNQVLYFVSGRSDNKQSTARNDKLKKAITTLNMATFADDGTLLNVMPTHFDFADGTTNISGFAISEDEKLLYFIEPTISGNKVVKSELYLVLRHGGIWEKKKRVSPAGLNFIKDPSIHQIDGMMVLLFAAKESSNADYDLYYSEILDDGKLNMAIALEELNSPFDESAPVKYGERIWFSSSGFPSIGGTDIHYASIDKLNVISNVENAGYGINSPYDETTIEFLDEDHIIVGSNRIGTKSIFSPSTCDDLFMVEKMSTSLSLQTGVKNNHTWLLGANLKLEEEINGQFSTKMILTQEDEKPIDIGLLPNRNYQLSASLEGFQSEVIRFSTFEPLDSKRLSGILNLEKKRALVEQKKLEIDNPFILKNIQFRQNDHALTVEAEKELDRVFSMMQKHDDIDIRFEAHTDSQGESKYNLNLSNKRAQSCKSYLVSKGIQPSRIQTKGLGEKMLLNHCIDGVNCSDEEHATNRRVTITITKGPKQILYDESQKKMSLHDNPSDVHLSLVNDAPKIKILNNNQVFGPIGKGEVIKGVFKMINVGSKELKIELASGCDCTELDWPRLPISPGQEFEISFIYDSNKKENIENHIDEVVVDIVANTEEQYTEAYFNVKYKK